MKNGYQYRFHKDVSLAEVEELLFLAVMSVENLHGRSVVRLEANFSLNREKHICEVEADNEIGCAIARTFTGYLTQQFGEEAFRVEQIGCITAADSLVAME